MNFLKRLAGIMTLLIILGAICTAAGIGSGFWWSAVTMTTVGYGDKAPITFGGSFGTIADTNGEIYLQDHLIAYTSYKTAVEGLGAIEAGLIEALVYDAPILRYLIHHEFQGGLEALVKKEQISKG